MNRKTIFESSVAKILAVFAGYYILCQAAIQLTIMPEGIVTFWPTNAVIVVALLLSPLRQWWLIILAGIAAEFAADFGHFPLWQIAGFGLVNAAEALLSVLSIRWLWLGRASFKALTVRGALVTSAVFLFVSTPLAALGGAALYTTGDPSVSYWEFWRLWWFGDATGLLVMVPFLLVWLGEPFPELIKEKRDRWQFGILGVVACVVTILIFFAPASWPVWASMPSLLLPVMAWAAIRFGLHGATAVMVIMAFMATGGATDGRGPFVHESSQAITVLLIQEYLLVVVVLTISLGTMFREMTWAKRALERERRTLEQRIAERTSELQDAWQAAEEQALKDALTGINNRRAFFGYANAIHDHAAATGRSYSIIMLDLDHFKSINDTYGHAAGDSALRSVAEIIQSIVRSSDVTGRVGGEEFAICLPDTRLDDAKMLAERLRCAIAGYSVSWKGESLALTCSAGVATYRDGDMSVDGAQIRADDALYQAKRAGRNYVIANG